MANQKQLALLHQKSTTHWNVWREEREHDFDIDLSGADLSGADLRFANFKLADLSGANLSEADLKGANLAAANLSYADLSKADLEMADLSEADLSHANLSYATLASVNLWEADLSEADLSYADVGWTLFAKVDLRTVKGLSTVEHSGPSTIGADTLMLSQGDISEIFLRGAGLSDTLIGYVRTLASNHIDYYTCFISYSSKDKNFADRLHADLQAKGVRCWLDKEDLKIGDKFRPRIDEAIRRHDKLLLVLSQYSVKSAWVETEVETAFEKERRYKKLVLFPIRLDEAVMQTRQAWAADIRRQRHIGDFTNWKNHDAYQNAFTRLLRDLKAETLMSS